MSSFAPIDWSPGDSAPTAAFVAAARVLEVVPPHERRGLLRDEAAQAVDRLLVRVARSRGALDVALSEGLAALSEGERLLRLGWSGPGDYARERLGVAGRTAQAMVRLGRGLRERPHLRAAVRSGAVSVRAAQEVLAVAVGEEERAWVERARRQTVRALLAAVREAGAQARAPEAGAGGEQARAAMGAGVSGGEQARAPLAGGAVPPAAARGCGWGPGARPGMIRLVGAQGCGAAPGATGGAADEVDEDGEEAWQGVELEVAAPAKAALDEALEVAGRVLGEASPRWQRLEAMAQEFLGAHPPEEVDEEWVEGWVAGWRGESLADRMVSGRREEAGAMAAGPWQREPGWRAALEAHLEEESREWVVLEEVDGVVAPEAAGQGEAAFDPAALDEGLRRLAGLRARWDDLIGHLGLLVRMLGLWREAGYASFAHYVRDRLGLGLRSVEQRVALERRLYDLPRLREAVEGGRVTAEQARLVARVATARSEGEWLGKAERRSCVELRREVEGLEEAEAEAEAQGARAGAQTRAAVLVKVPAPVRVARLFAQALQAARRATMRAEGRWLGRSECLERVASHFVAAWGGLPKPRSTPERRARARDQHRCQVPGCSRAAVHGHHVVFRSHGGGHEATNLTGLCAAHHLAAVHGGWLRVRGVAPDRLVWELAESGRRLGPAARDA